MARQLNEKWEQEGHVFGGRYRCEASRDYLAGDYWREFPAGTFRPQLIEPCKPEDRYWSGYV
ncbi:MAG: hypothetical protein R6V85_15280 [Polyangia bacterium]